MTRYQQLVEELQSIPLPISDEDCKRWKEKMEKLHSEFKVLDVALSYDEEFGWVLFAIKETNIIK